MNSFSFGQAAVKRTIALASGLLLLGFVVVAAPRPAFAAPDAITPVEEFSKELDKLKKSFGDLGKKIDESAKAIDGYATSLPFTTQAVVKGSAVMLASATVDAPDLLPFAYGLIYTRPETCAQNRDKCMRLVRALAAANKLILEKPDAALGLIRKRFDKMDPAVLSAAWQVVAQAHARDIAVPVAGLDHSQRVSIEAKLLDPKDTLTSFDGLYTGDYLH